nr:MAG TPA: hypothetical protein [Caudoviricetes sp.]
MILYCQPVDFFKLTNGCVSVTARVWQLGTRYIDKGYIDMNYTLIV